MFRYSCGGVNLRWAVPSTKLLAGAVLKIVLLVLSIYGQHVVAIGVPGLTLEFFASDSGGGMHFIGVGFQAVLLVKPITLTSQ